MAKVSMRMPEDFLLKISKLGDKTDEIIPKVLESGGEVVLEHVKSNLKSSIGKGTKVKSRSTGELVSSLGLSPALLDRNGKHKASTHISSRAYFTAYVLSNEGYDVTICPVHDMIL